MDTEKAIAMSKSPYTNCLICGRDTARKSGICWRCEGHGTHVQEKRDRHVLHVDGDPPMKTIDLDAEDDYSEESGPDSVYTEAWDLRKGFQERRRP